MRIVLSLWTFFFSINAFGFNPEDSVRKIKHEISGFYLGGAFNIRNDIVLTDAQLMKLWPEFHNQYYSNYPIINTGGYSSNEIIEAGFNFLTPVNSKFLQNKLRTNVSVIATQYDIGSSNFEMITKKRIDTLVSSSSAPNQYRDSIKTERIYLSYFAKYFGLGISETYDHNLNKFISWNVGVGCRFLYSVQPSISEFHISNTYTNTTTDPNYSYNSYNLGRLGVNNDHFSGRSISTTKNSSMTFLYFSGGFNMRIFRLKKWNSALYFDPSLNAGINIVNLEGVGTFSKPFFGIMVRLKYIMN
jgi:hypothetical protein